VSCESDNRLSRSKPWLLRSWSFFAVAAGSVVKCIGEGLGGSTLVEATFASPCRKSLPGSNASSGPEMGSGRISFRHFGKCFGCLLINFLSFLFASNTLAAFLSVAALCFLDAHPPTEATSGGTSFTASTGSFLSGADSVGDFDGGGFPRFVRFWSSDSGLPRLPLHPPFRFFRFLVREIASCSASEFPQFMGKGEGECFSVLDSGVEDSLPGSELWLKDCFPIFVSWAEGLLPILESWVEDFPVLASLAEDESWAEDFPVLASLAEDGCFPVLESLVEDWVSALQSGAEDCSFPVLTSLAEDCWVSVLESRDEDFFFPIF
jgi:hypothetical protein